MRLTQTQQTQRAGEQGQSATGSTATRLIQWIPYHWILVFGVGMGLYVGLPLLAPVFMQLGWTGPAKVIYLIYATQCHQLPQRSFFLFGAKAMYSLGEIQLAWGETQDPLVLRQFIGNPDFGWKVAWSDRMVAMYASLLISGILWWPFRQRIKPIAWWGFALLLLPMAVDGGTHLLSDLAGIGQGFRDSNQWLVNLTQEALPSTFYEGDALGTFNSGMRLLTGTLFGIGVVWFGFPYLDEWIRMNTRRR